MSIKNNRLLKAIYRQPLDRTPVWIMRQAGRYLPEYQKIRKQAGDFMQLCQTPTLACEVTLQPLRRYPLDAAIIFSDILTIPHAMGLQLKFIEGTGPVFENPIKTITHIHQLVLPDLSQLEYVYDAIRLVTHELDHSLPLIGFCGSPWTLAAYMVQGKSVPGFPQLFKLLQTNPSDLHHLLDLLSQSIVMHLNAQIEAGASVVMIFDTWGGLLSHPLYETFSLNYMKKIISGLHKNSRQERVPCILFTKGGSAYLNEMSRTGAAMLGVDWEISLHSARKMVDDQVALQGNLHPQVLLSTREKIREEVAAVLASYGSGSGHVFNLGHGITPDVPPEHVTALVEAVHEFSPPYHKEEK